MTKRARRTRTSRPKGVRAFLLRVDAKLDVIIDRVRRHPIFGEVYEFFDGSIGDYARDHGPMYSGALAFYAILSLIPLVVLFASVSAYIVSSGSAHDVDSALGDAMVQLKKVIPYLQASFEDDLRTIIVNRRSLGLVGVFALLLSSSEVFRALEFALARIFARLDHELPDDKKTAPRSYLASKLLFGAFVTSLLLAFFTVRLAIGVLKHVRAQVHLPSSIDRLIGDPLAGSSAFGEAFTAVAIIFGFALLIKVFTPHGVRLRFAVLGGGVFYVLLHAAHRAYDVYLKKFTNVGAMYGSLATLVTVILWIYFSASLLLICCHVVKVLQRRFTVGARWPKNGSLFFLR